MPDVSSQSVEPTDIARSAMNLLFALAQPATSEITRLVGYGVAETERARKLEGPVTPAAGAFLIWIPIFLTSVLYAARSATGKRLHDPVLRQVGWLTGAAYAGNVAWSLNSQLRGLGWTSVVIIATSGASATAALIKAERSQNASPTARLVASSIAPLAGWLTVATFANIEATLNGKRGRLRRRKESCRAVKLVAAATGAAAATTLASRGNPLFALAAGWGLGGVVVKNARNGNGQVVAAAGLGLAALAGVLLWARKR